ncbi:hypothetical protein LIA77_07304 [Sarocladium implicatum]|nr:hypothetical protein LIA77_07304 [Sarocladium implicatum]
MPFRKKSRGHISMTWQARVGCPVHHSHKCFPLPASLHDADCRRWIVVEDKTRATCGRGHTGGEAEPRPMTLLQRE